MKTFIFFATLAFCFVTQANPPEQEAVPGEFVIKVKNQSEFLRSIDSRSFSAKDVRSIGSIENNLFVVSHYMVDRAEDVFQNLRQDSNIEIVEPNYIYHLAATPNDQLFGDLWGLNANQSSHGIQAQKAWDITTGSENVIVAVVDTGIDYKHPDLFNNMWVNEAEKFGEPGVDDDGNGWVDDIHGYDFINGDSDPLDDHGHGTHCAGTIGAEGNNDLGVTGINWNVKLMALKIFTRRGTTSLDKATEAIDYATQMGAHVENHSWGGRNYSKILFEAIERSHQGGVVFVAAAGNNRKNLESTNFYPAGYEVDNIISVASITSQGSLSGFSNYGSTRVDIAAPGSNIMSTWMGGTFRSISGTSMASPHVAGVAGLVKSSDLNMSHMEIKERILQSARPNNSVSTKVATGGVLDAYEALTVKVVIDPKLPDQTAL